MMDHSDNLAQIVHTLHPVGDESVKAKEHKKIQVIVFEIDGEEFAVDILDLQEIIEVPPITPIPNAPIFIRGLLNLRGKIVVVVDLEKRFGLIRQNTSQQKHIIISENEGTHFGICVDYVKEILIVNEDDIKPAPEVVSHKIHSDYLKGIIVIDKTPTAQTDTKAQPAQPSDANPVQSSRLIVCMDVKKLLREQELMNFGDKVQSVAESI